MSAIEMSAFCLLKLKIHFTFDAESVKTEQTAMSLFRSHDRLLEINHRACEQFYIGAAFSRYHRAEGSMLMNERLAK